MAQRDKVKELVGRGLNSYHTKSLQQMDRIEKKNKEQNHKISILSNELDNDYLTKTEESSVISLEHSKEGMVYLDELQGNTLVNYCTDGSKELTLNGDIDVEGTFITTTEGVDNGKVDVMCEGNTLVNLIGGIESTGYAYVLEDNVIEFDVRASTSTRWPSCKFYVNQLQLGKTYTIIFNVLRADIGFNVGGTQKVEISTIKHGITSKGFVSFKFTLPTTGEVPYLLPIWTEVTPSSTGEKITIKKPIILEGDWTDKPIPQYFEGMKSVGQDDENGHKIEILSRNKNHVLSKPMTVVQDIVSHDIYLEPNKEYSISSNVPYNGGLCMISKNHSNTNPIFTFQNWGETVNKFTTPNNLEKGIYSLVFWKSQLSADDNSWTQVELGKTITNYIPYNSNKKEILINEPLHKLPSEIKDKIVKIGGKYFIEKNCKEIILDGNEDSWVKDGESDTHIGIYMTNSVGTLGFATDAKQHCIGDKIPTVHNSYWKIRDREGIIDNTGNIALLISKSKLTTNDISGFKQWLQTNPIKVIYKLATPIYEPLEIEPTLNTYNDVTHISNNSIIPCNMKIKNSGYNAIIKPSTLYTVAIGTDKGGTIGMNLGGAKVTTTNNVAKITTPATLTDDSLRLYGKGRKGSKVRLLEGDKTNWIPSHFEGMKSSFEDKLQDDGSYKMEILSHNKNLIDFNKISQNGQISYKIDKENANVVASSNANGIWQNIGMDINVKNNKTYTLSYEDVEYTSHNGVNVELNWLVNIYEGKPNRLIAKVNYNTKNTTFTIPKDVNVKDLRIRIHITQGTSDSATIKIKGLMLTESTKKLDFAPPTSNKIQFSSIEPLRSVGTARDRFVFIGNKLKIERNVGSYIINGTEQWYYALDPAYVNHNNIYFRTRNLVNDKKTLGAVRNDKLPNYIDDILWSSDRMGFGTNDQYFVNGFCVRLPRRIIGNGTRAEMERNCKEWLSNNNLNVVYALEEPTYEEIPFELQKIILEGYENGTIFFDTNIPPTSTVTYAGETPIVKATRLNKTEVLNNTEDINDNIIPYLMDMDYRVVCLQLATEEIEGGVSMARLFGGTYEMIKRDILSKRLTREEYGYRLADYFNAGKLTEEQVRELEDLR